MRKVYKPAKNLDLGIRENLRKLRKKTKIKSRKKKRT